MPKEKENIEVEAKIYLSFGPSVKEKEARDLMDRLITWLHGEMGNCGEDILETDRNFSFSATGSKSQFKVTKY